MNDAITVLKCADNAIATKKWEADGTIRAFDNAAFFQVVSKPVNSIGELHKLMERLHGEPQCCVIRGGFVGKKKALAISPSEKPGYYRRNNQLFEECPHHWVMADIDGYRPQHADPVQEPGKAIDEYIARRLPAEFQGCSYSWQLSSSAGAPGKTDILKAHVWFWLKQAYTGPELTAWARATGVELDVSVLRRVQPHYTAAPLFAEGMTDPVPVRIGFEPGWNGDEVDLVIEADVLENARSFSANSEIELVDPKSKPGVIGAFCRAFTMETVFSRWLADTFAFQDGSERRLNFLKGGGSPGGAFLSECGEYVISMHNSDPMKGRATNKWDLVRHYCYGSLDVGKDEAELMDLATRPSQVAMVEMAKQLPEVIEQLAAVQATIQVSWKEKIEAAADGSKLREIAAKIASERQMDTLTREQLAELFKQRFKALGAKVGIGTIRGLLGFKKDKGLAASSSSSGAPDWVKPWVYVTDCDKFFNLVSKEKISEQGFNARHTRLLTDYVDMRTGKLPAASRHCLDYWDIPCVSHLGYMPMMPGATFTMLGKEWANLYSDALVPAPETCDEAVEIVQVHLEKMFPDARERGLFISWLAQNVRHPGVKIRWAPYICGFEGDGKSFFLELLAAVMGGSNIRTVSGSTLESNFTEWAIGHAVVGIEEMKQHGHNRYDVMNRLKPFITNATVEIHPKGKASYVAPNTANYVILSNYLDGAPVSESDRRYFFLSSAITQEMCPQLSAEGYFEILFKVLVEHPGALRKWLLECELVAEFNPNGRAPFTATKASVVELTRSETETLARDVIEEGVEGVHARVVSSPHLARAIRQEMGDDAKICTTQLNTLLSRLGYRFLDRKFWEGGKRGIWVKGAELTWDEAKPMLDATIKGR